MRRTVLLPLATLLGAALLGGCAEIIRLLPNNGSLDGTPQNPHVYQADLPNPWPIDSAARVTGHDRDPGDHSSGPDFGGSSSGSSSGGSSSGGSSSGGSGSGGSSSGGDGGDGCEPEKDKDHPNNGYGNGGGDGVPGKSDHEDDDR